ncbi:MFS general substrate transporter [Polyplosphaeria fusca]|uniref:MFS general substrate transporter n=1 Tax=Polyplosphaeria fusca TaxID=682080 RepID=A0A9P4V871_9PLEO|nr:MFS general substrate transporter [Polyplosphaeria fusca]
MAYLLFKYIRGKLQDRKQPNTAADSHLGPKIESGRKESEHVDHLQPGDERRIDEPSQRAFTDTDIAQMKKEKHNRRAYRWKMVIGLILPNFLAAVDVTIVAPAVPIISSHFNRLSGSFNWIVAAYTLTLTTFVPSSGQIADVYGRHTALQFHVFFIMIGSVFCAAAATWGMLLLGRALQGLGGAGIMNLTRIILSDNVSLAENSRNNTVFSLIAGVSYAVGPVIGGYLASAGWRYCFVVPIGVAFVSHILIFVLMRKDLVKGRAATQMRQSKRLGYISGLAVFDWPGMVLFIFGIGLIILAIMWGGTQYSWNSAAVVAPLVIGALLSVLFFVHEYLLGHGRIMSRVFPKQRAMIPSFLFRKADTWSLMIINFATGVSLVSAFYFISIFWELAEGYSASGAGVQLLYYTPGLGVGVYSAMFLCNVWPRQTFFPLFFGSVIETTGLALLTWAVTSRHKALVNGMLALAGAGTGLRFMPVALHAAGTWRSHIPVIQSLLSFMIPFGETIGISMMGAVFTNKFNLSLRSLNSGQGQEFPSNGPPNLNILDDLPPDIKSDVQNAAAKAVMWAFVSILPFMALSTLACAFLGNVWIGKPESKDDKGKIKREEIKGKVMYRSFLAAVLTGNITNWSTNLDPLPKVEEEEVELKKFRDVESGAGASPIEERSKGRPSSNTP